MRIKVEMNGIWQEVTHEQYMRLREYSIMAFSRQLEADARRREEALSEMLHDDEKDGAL